MANDDSFKPYGCIISCALSSVIDDMLWSNVDSYRKGEFTTNICDMIVEYLHIPISVIIEHGSYQTYVTLTSLTSTHKILYKFPSVVSDTKHLVGNDAVNKLSSIALNHPICNGIITKHSLLQIDMIWDYIFNNLLLTKAPKYHISSHSVMIILPPQTMNNIRLCDKMIEFLFKVYNVPALAIMDKASLSCHYYCYSSPSSVFNKSGLVVDLGHDICTITPVFDFKADLNKMYCTKLFSAKSLEQYIYNVLKEHRFPSNITNRLKEIENIKMNYIKIALNRNEYEYIILNANEYNGIEYITTDNKLHCWILNWILYDIGEYLFYPHKYDISFPHYIDVNNWKQPKNAFKLKRFTINENNKYSYLWDKKKKQKYNDENDENEEKQNEFVFKGLQKLIFDVIMEYNIEERQKLLNNIILTGGMSYINGIGNRLKQEIVELVMNKKDILLSKNNENDKDIVLNYNVVYEWINVVVGDKRNECNSICASMLTSMPSMANIWLLRDEYFQNQMSQDI